MQSFPVFSTPHMLEMYQVYRAPGKGQFGEKVSFNEPLYNHHSFPGLPRNLGVGASGRRSFENKLVGGFKDLAPYSLNCKRSGPDPDM